jgi:hypothetical protein
MGAQMSGRAEEKPHGTKKLVEESPLGVARAISPHARYGAPGLRSLGGNLAFAILAALGFLRRSIGTGNPERRTRPEVGKETEAMDGKVSVKPAR